ncbi:MAG: Uncharacterised protein [SAR116 cluster bacterium MED-G04]|nr:MAG: Uncharacterised protein [SAR116 cluster bacterium MED-G04]
MSVSSQGWNSLSEHKTEDTETDREDQAQDRWIWGVWLTVALISVAILPFASRLDGVARSIARFCGFGI